MFYRVLNTILKSNIKINKKMQLTSKCMEVLEENTPPFLL